MPLPDRVRMSASGRPVPALRAIAQPTIAPPTMGQPMVAQ
jgi:hypothetical protein